MNAENTAAQKALDMHRREHQLNEIISQRPSRRDLIDQNVVTSGFYRSQRNVRTRNYKIEGEGTKNRL
eukprot:TRINITY_DN721_c0_g1_i1.p1 TRINITY_DN721_c0_g1~~TRINITY_DN721_c0_g1_i1.p1  ORF type:complete len:68 (+),score=6.28 TRINITY_DN721_c0_g1_i1:227-430(+)